MSDRNIRTLKSDDKPPSSPSKEDDPTKIPPKKPPKKRESPKPKPEPEPKNGVKSGNEPVIRKRNLVEQTKKPDENMQIKPMQDEVSTCHSRCVTWTIDANLRTFFFLNPMRLFFQFRIDISKIVLSNMKPSCLGSFSSVNLNS